MGEHCVEQRTDAQPVTGQEQLSLAGIPDSNGELSVQLLKALWPQVKVILLSMYPEYRDEALAAGADAFVGKGEAPDELLDLLAAVMQKGDKAK